MLAVWGGVMVAKAVYGRNSVNHRLMLGVVKMNRPELLFVCVHNAGRSQMAAVFAAHLSEGRVSVRSAGSTPATEIDPVVVEAMTELGLDLSTEFPKPLADEFVRAADVVVTMGCGDACPVYPGKRYLDWEVPDPAGQSIETVREIRDEIRGRVTSLLEEISSQPDDGSKHAMALTYATWVEPVASALAADRRELLKFIENTGEGFWGRPSAVAGWTNKEILAHLAGGNDQLVQTLLDAIVNGQPLDPKVLNPDTDMENERRVAERQAWTVEALIAELKRDRDEVLIRLSQLKASDQDLRPEGLGMTVRKFLVMVQEEHHDLIHLRHLAESRALLADES